MLLWVGKGGGFPLWNANSRAGNLSGVNVWGNTTFSTRNLPELAWA
jgi:hypothetical protein